jgi:hypothetical protein
MAKSATVSKPSIHKEIKKERKNKDTDKENRNKI